jgi:PEGA domain-containing protein
VTRSDGARLFVLGQLHLPALCRVTTTIRQLLRPAGGRHKFNVSSNMSRASTDRAAGIRIAQLLGAVPCPTGSVPVPRQKRILFLLVLAAALSGAAATPIHAQPRRVVRVAPRVVFVGGYYADPFWFYDPWFGYAYQYPWGWPAPPYRYAYDPGAAVRLEVKPKQAEVYADGYYAGIVDDFDGTFQRLRLPPGEHELTLYLDGYRTVHQRIYLTPNNTFKLKYSMERLAPGEAPDPRPQAPTPPETAAPGAPPMPGPGAPPAYPYPPSRGPMERRPPQPPAQPPMPPAPPDGRAQTSPSTYGTLVIRVQPGDADVLVDGEAWRSPAGQERLVVQVAEGRHAVEIRKSGFRTYVTEIDVRRGETTPLNVSLRSQDDR